MKVIKPSNWIVRGPVRPRNRKASTGEPISMRSGWLQCVAMAACALLLASCGSSSKSAFVYLASQGTSPGIVTAYKVDLRSGVLNSSNGALVQTGNAVKAGTQPTVLLFDPTSSFAYAANFGSNDISLFTLSKDGALAAAS